MLMTPRISFGEAIETYRKAIEADPTFQDAYFNLAGAYHARDQFEEAISYYQQAIALDDSDPDAHYNLAHAYQETEQVDLAIRAYEKARSLNPEDTEVYYHLARMYEKRGDRLTMKRYLDLFLERAADLPQFQDEIEVTKQMLVQ